MKQVSEQISKSNKVGVETFETVANATFAGMERLVALNLNTARLMLEKSTSNSRSLLAATDPGALLALQLSAARTDSNQAADYSRRVFEIATETREVVTKLVDTHVSEINHEFEQAFADAAKTVPSGSDLALDTLRSALSTANAAYDSMNKAARQTNSLVESNLAVVAGFLAKPTQKVS